MPRITEGKKAMKKEKLHLEYTLNATSKNIIWSSISTPAGLEEWFANKVISDGKTVTFYWGKTEKREAEIVAMRACSFIRFRWLDIGDEREYFELKMTNNELTGDYMLEVIEFVSPDEIEDQKELWNSEVEKLRRAYGF
ncbi:hypothetical protein EZS27_026244 [termite gut metagenome]|uniref:START-like domain-containing protein n=1 Tax=termite gut metagenome TaxID=433724 RepID=A0A5J4QR37_9ZZZZ